MEPKRYDEAIHTFESMLDVIERSDDPAIWELRKEYISPSETIAAIDAVVRRILKSCPLVVIDVTTGCLCDGPERARTFRAGATFKELVSSMTRELDNERVSRVVESFFAYVMFSHAWQGNEPLYQDVKEAKSVWNLPDTPLNDKLRNFCKETHRLGYNWAWSDTFGSHDRIPCWHSASVQTWDLARSLWMTRAWTLQELLAPKVIVFYDSEWQPFLGDASVNHKESRKIIQELVDAVKISHGTIVRFSPDDLGVREKLRLASSRNATVEEDVAYALIGIFKSDIKTPLCCLPASVSVYNQTPYNPPSLEGEEMETCITQLRSKLNKQDSLSIYKRISSLPPARFATRRLHLPCIVFPVRGLSIIQRLGGGNEKLYHARVLGLGNVEFTTADDLPLRKPRILTFVHPWIRYIRGPSDEVADGVSDAGSISDSDSDAGSYDVVCPSPLDVPPTPQVDKYTQALQTIARLGQPFNALLLLQQPNGEYKRVATENEIVVSGFGTDITSKASIRVKVLEFCNV
ncbi:hypothetical protein EDC04DRAFT_2605490 [Pisolithus marmoratus]|nr:hypothetical protein EDC04DRAFT_2605490 [Pisolithus marmoratus]